MSGETEVDAVFIRLNHPLQPMHAASRRDLFVWMSELQSWFRILPSIN